MRRHLFLTWIIKSQTLVLWRSMQAVFVIKTLDCNHCCFRIFAVKHILENSIHRSGHCHCGRMCKQHWKNNTLYLLCIGLNLCRYSLFFFAYEEEVVISKTVSSLQAFNIQRLAQIYVSRSSLCNPFTAMYNLCNLSDQAYNLHLTTCIKVYRASVV